MIGTKHNLFIRKKRLPRKLKKSMKKNDTYSDWVKKFKAFHTKGYYEMGSSGGIFIGFNQDKETEV